MTYSEEHLSVTLPLTTLAHLIATKSSEHHNENVLKANEIFLNTLAVYAVYSYLQRLHIQKNVEESDSWNGKDDDIFSNTLALYPVHSYLQMLSIQVDLEASNSRKHTNPSCMKIVDLWMTNMSQLDCRPVWLEAQVCSMPLQICSMPLEVGENRIGSVVVQISESLEEAEILGFSQTALTGNLKIEELQSLEHLIELLPSDVPMKEPVNLSQWFQNIFEVSWHTVEALLNPEQDVLGFIPRSPQELRVNEPAGVRRAKLIELGKQSARDQVVLVVGLTPAADSRINVWVEVYPTSTQTHLPQTLQLKVLNEKGAVVGEAIARNNKNIQFKFSGEPGERFNVKVTLNNVSITEPFLI